MFKALYTLLKRRTLTLDTHSTSRFQKGFRVNIIFACFLFLTINTMSRRMLPWWHFIMYLKALVTVMYHSHLRLCLNYKDVKNHHGKVHSVLPFPDVYNSYLVYRWQMFWQPLYYLETYTFTTRRGESSLPKSIPSPPEVSSLPEAQLCSTLN